RESSARGRSRSRGWTRPNSSGTAPSDPGCPSPPRARCRWARTVRPGTGWSSWPRWPMRSPRGRQTDPPSAARRPVSTSSRVDLPEPFAPVISSCCPADSDSDTGASRPWTRTSRALTSTVPVEPAAPRGAGGSCVRCSGAGGLRTCSGSSWARRAGDYRTWRRGRGRLRQRHRRGTLAHLFLFELGQACSGLAHVASDPGRVAVGVELPGHPHLGAGGALPAPVVGVPHRLPQLLQLLLLLLEAVLPALPGLEASQQVVAEPTRVGRHPANGPSQRGLGGVEIQLGAGGLVEEGAVMAGDQHRARVARDRAGEEGGAL